MRKGNFRKIVLSIAVSFLMIPTVLTNANEKCSITVSNTINDKPIIDSKFKLYKVGKVSSEDRISLTENFIGSKVDVKNLDKEGDKLEAYIKENKIKSEKEEKTNTEGKANFVNLDEGVYLILGDEETLIKTKPIIVTVSKKSEAGKDIAVNAKNDEADEKINLKVEKVWLNDENIKERPESIEVDLYKNDNKVDTITLNEKNKWTHTWENLEGKYNWTVVEKNIPKDYEVSYEKYTTHIKIKNTYKEVKPEVPETVLPQTGSPWLIAQGLALTGIILVGIGYTLKKRNG